MTVRLSEPYIDAAAVICDLQKLQAAVPHQHLERGGSGVDSILDQFLECMDRGYNNFPCGNLVHHVLIESLHSATG